MRLAVLVLAVGLPLGCGYALVGAGLDGVDTVAIRTPENDTIQPGVEFVVADALRRELLRRDGAALTEDPSRAGLVVSGRILRIDSSSRAFSSVILAREYEVVLELALDAVRRDGRALTLPGGALRETERYRASADVEVEQKNRQEAVRRLSGLLAARFFDAVSEALP